MNEMSFRTSLEGNVEQALKNETFGFFFIILKPSFTSEFKQFEEKGWEGCLFGDYKDKSHLNEGFAVEIDGDICVIPYNAIERYERLGPY